MSDALSFDQIDEQHVELLPARIVMSMFTIVGEGNPSNPGDSGGGDSGGIGTNLLTDILGPGGPSSSDAGGR